MMDITFVSRHSLLEDHFPGAKSTFVKSPVLPSTDQMKQLEYLELYIFDPASAV